MGMSQKNFKSASPHSSVDYVAAALGGGSGNPPTLPADGVFTPTTSTYPLHANALSSGTNAVAPTRTSTGIYTLTLKHQPKFVLFAKAEVLQAGASPTTGLTAKVVSYDPVAKVATVRTYVDTTGVLTDAGTNDMIVLYVTAQDSTV